MLRLILIGLSAAALAVLAACSQGPETETAALLQVVPADTPYVYVSAKPLPDALRTRFADYYAAQLAQQRPVLARVREQLADQADVPETVPVRALFDVLDALFAELEGHDSAAGLRELGIDPTAPAVIYGIGILPALRIGIPDAQRVAGLLDRVEQRAGTRASQGTIDGQSYRRIDLGPFDLVIAVTDHHLAAGLLADPLFDRHLPMLLGQEPPADSLARSGEIAALVRQHGFTGHGAGFVRLDRLGAILTGRSDGLNAEVSAALAGTPPSLSTGCAALAEQLVAGMPRLVGGISEVGERRLVVRSIWEAEAGVAGYLQRLAAPVPGMGAPYDGLIAMGVGLELPQLRNAIDALVRRVTAAGADCDWVDGERLAGVMPQVNLALGPLTAGIRGFHLRVDDVTFDPETLEPRDVQAALLAAVDDPRGIVALGAMFSPELAALDIPRDGSFVDLSIDPADGATDGRLRLAVRDRALLVVAGGAPDGATHPLLDAVATEPAALLAIDYGVRRVVERFGGVLERVASQLADQGETGMAQELGAQLADFRLQAQMFERQRVMVYASDAGLVFEQAMELR